MSADWIDTGNGPGYPAPHLLCGADLGDGLVCLEVAGHPGHLEHKRLSAAIVPSESND